VVQLLQESCGSAFVDLAQVGFLGHASADPLGRHHIRAHNLAAMAQTFQRRHQRRGRRQIRARRR
jgi:hypothetical protein